MVESSGGLHTHTPVFDNRGNNYNNGQENTYRSERPWNQAEAREDVD